MKRRAFVWSLSGLGLVGCASPVGLGYQRVAPQSGRFTPRFVIDFNSEDFSSGVAKELAYLRAPEFAKRFTATFGAVLAHNGVTSDVALESSTSQTAYRATLLADVTDVEVRHIRVGRLQWRWRLFDPDGVLIARWESLAPWEGYSTWGGGPNERHVDACIQDLALLALNTLQANGQITLNRTPAETPSGLRKALF